jgi:predicted enzyme related to lactoylglutathione lyase
VDLATPDLDAAIEFYGELFGWEVPEHPNSAEMGGYRRARKGDADVAGMMPPMGEGEPTAWNTHISVADVDAAAAAVRENGGSVLAEPMDVMGWLRFGVFMDPQGAVFGLTQPLTFKGAERVNEVGTFGWNELNTRDPEAAEAFYGAVLGWEFETVEFEGMGPYTNIKLADGAVVGGMLDMRGRVPEEVPPHWLVYFGVEQIDSALETVRRRGGDVAFGPLDIPAGRFAVVSDPWGAFFAAIQPKEEG